MKKSTTCTAEGFGVTSSNCVTPSAVLYPTNDTRMKSAGHSRRGPYAPRLGKLARAAMDEYERAYNLLKWSGNEELPPSSLKKSLSYVWDGDDETLAKHIKNATGQLYEKYDNSEFWEFGPDLMRLEKIDKAKEAERVRRSQGRKRATKKSDAQQLEERKFVIAIEAEVEKRRKTDEKEAAMWERLAQRFNFPNGVSLKNRYHYLRKKYGFVST